MGAAALPAHAVSTMAPRALKLAVAVIASQKEAEVGRRTEAKVRDLRTRAMRARQQCDCETCKAGGGYA